MFMVAKTTIRVFWHVTSCILRSGFYLEDGKSRFLRNVRTYLLEYQGYNPEGRKLNFHLFSSSM